MPELTMPTLALLAGGLATRMRPKTLWTAKSMLAVAGEPFLAHQLRLLVAQGIRDVVVCCGHFEEQIRRYSGDGSAWGCRILYSPDGPVPLGTGGAVRKALPLLGPRFMVMYGDSYLQAPFAPVWQRFLESGAQGLMSVYRNAGRWDASNVEVSGGKIRDYSKEFQTPEMRHIDYGLSCFRAEAFDSWPEGPFDLADLTTNLLAHGKLAACEVGERFYEIGSPAGLAELDALLGQTVSHAEARL